MTASRSIVLVEDDEGQAVLFMKQLRRGGVQNPIHHFATGSSALTFLDTANTSAEAPHLIVLDINLPDMTGTEVLARISALPALSTIPVVMLTSSDDQSDARLSFELGAAHYMVKPLQVQRFVEVCSDVGCSLSVEPVVGLDTPTDGPASDREA